MTTIKEQYDQYLDGTDHETIGAIIADYQFSHVMQEIDPIRYNCDLDAYEPTCEICGETFSSGGDDEAEAICETCAEKQDSEAEEV